VIDQSGQERTQAIATVISRIWTTVYRSTIRLQPYMLLSP